MNKEKVVEKAQMMAKTDLQVNGAYSNAPYKIHHEGERYVAKITRIPRDDETDVYLTIIKPEEQIDRIMIIS